MIDEKLDIPMNSCDYSNLLISNADLVCGRVDSGEGIDTEDKTGKGKNTDLHCVIVLFISNDYGDTRMRKGENSEERIPST